MSDQLKIKPYPIYAPDNFPEPSPLLTIEQLQSAYGKLYMEYHQLVSYTLELREVFDEYQRRASATRLNHLQENMRRLLEMELRQTDKEENGEDL